MARQSLALAANQGLIYVLAMVVVGALVGAGGLGYDVVAGFVQSSISVRASPPALPSCSSESCWTG